jgi:hypothetical protein
VTSYLLEAFNSLSNYLSPKCPKIWQQYQVPALFVHFLCTFCALFVQVHNLIRFWGEHVESWSKLFLLFGLFQDGFLKSSTGMLGTNTDHKYHAFSFGWRPKDCIFLLFNSAAADLITLLAHFSFRCAVPLSGGMFRSYVFINNCNVRFMSKSWASLKFYIPANILQ